MTPDEMKAMGLIALTIVIGGLGILVIIHLFKSWQRAAERNQNYLRRKLEDQKVKAPTDIWLESGKRFTESNSGHTGTTDPEGDPGQFPFSDDEDDEVDNETDNPFNRH